MEMDGGFISTLKVSAQLWSEDSVLKTLDTLMDVIHCQFPAQIPYINKQQKKIPLGNVDRLIQSMLGKLGSQLVVGEAIDGA